MAVLRLLEQGKISAAEAADLLRALHEAPRHRGPLEPPGWGGARAEEAARRMAERIERMAVRGRRQAEYFARHADEIAGRAAEQAARAAEVVGENVGRIFANLPEYLDRAARSGWSAWGPGFRFEQTVEGVLEGEGGPAGLDLEGWNGNVRLHGTDGGPVRLILRKTVHAASEEQAALVADAVTATIFGRQVSVHRTDVAEAWPGGLSLEAFLPRDAVWGGLVRTGNGAIEIDGLTLRGLRAETSNGRVIVEACAGEDVTVSTSNGQIRAQGLHGHVELRTSNGGITVQLPPADGATNLQAVSSNGSIDVELPPASRVQVDATTSNGRIETVGLGPDAPTVHGTGRAELHWRSPDAEAAVQVQLVLRTTNGPIRLR